MDNQASKRVKLECPLTIKNVSESIANKVATGLEYIDDGKQPERSFDSREMSVTKNGWVYYIVLLSRGKLEEETDGDPVLCASSMMPLSPQKRVYVEKWKDSDEARAMAYDVYRKLDEMFDIDMVDRIIKDIDGVDKNDASVTVDGAKYYLALISRCCFNNHGFKEGDVVRVRSNESD